MDTQSKRPESTEYDYMRETADNLFPPKDMSVLPLSYLFRQYVWAIHHRDISTEDIDKHRGWLHITLVYQSEIEQRLAKVDGETWMRFTL